jgi:hypothetical protein
MGCSGVLHKRLWATAYLEEGLKEDVFKQIAITALPPFQVCLNILLTYLGIFSNLVVWWWWW